jgi:hypothetical protein
LLSIAYIVLAINIQELGINSAILVLFLVGFIVPLFIDKTSYKRIVVKSIDTNQEVLQSDITATVITTAVNKSELNN